MIRVTVPGIPAPGGSKKAFRHAATGKIIVMDTCNRNKSWRDTVASFALEAMVGQRPLDGALKVQFYFTMPRPKSHYGTGKNSGKLKKSAPVFHTSPPDLTKLIRSTEDACKGLLWRDDAVISVQEGQKVYTDTYVNTRHPGVVIVVTRP